MASRDALRVVRAHVEDRILESTLRQIPARYRDAVLDDPVAAGWAADPAGTLLITGGIGAGKSHLAWAVVRALAVRGRLARGWQMAIWLDRMRAADEGARVLWSAAAAAPVLLLDDVAATKMTEWAQERLLTLCDHRYAALLPTIVTTSHRPGDLADHVGSATASRWRHDVTIVHVSGPDRRAAR